MIIQPFRQAVVSSGKMDYNESSRAWSRIRFKKEFVNEFPQLRHRRFKTEYSALILHSYELLEREVQDIIKRKGPIPVLLFFSQEVE